MLFQNYYSYRGVTMKMLKVLIIYILIAVISFIAGKNIWVNHNKHKVDTKIECEGGICEPPE